MREIRIILPRAAGERPQQWLEAELVKAFGGWTRALTFGAWLSDGKLETEPGYTYDIAVKDEPMSDFALKRIVGELFARTTEQAIYVRERTGQVVIYDRSTAAIAA